MSAFFPHEKELWERTPLAILWDNPFTTLLAVLFLALLHYLAILESRYRNSR